MTKPMPEPVSVDPRIVELYNEYIHGEMPRRSFLTRVAEVAGGAAAASLVLPLVESNFAWGRQVDPSDARLEEGYIEYPGRRGPVKAYFAKPAGSGSPLPGILVIHENRGQTILAKDNQLFQPLSEKLISLIIQIEP